MEAAERYMFQKTETTLAKSTRSFRGTSEKLIALARGQSL